MPPIATSSFIDLLAQTTATRGNFALATPHGDLERVGPFEFSRTSWSLIERLGLSALTVVFAFGLLRLIPLLERVVIRWASHHDGGDATASTIDRQQRVETLTRVTSSIAQSVIWSVTVVIVLGNLGVAIAPLIAGAGIAGVAVGFGAQSIVKDFFSGFFILLENQYDVGDTVTIGTTTGTVERMTMRITVLRDTSGTAYFIPNSSATTVANRTYGWARPTIEAVFAPSVPIERARAALEAAAAAAGRDDDCKSDLLEPPTVEGPIEFAASGVTWRIVARTRAGHAPAAKRAMVTALSRELQKGGFAAEGSALVVRDVKEPAEANGAPPPAPRDTVP